VSAREGGARGAESATALATAPASDDSATSTDNPRAPWRPNDVERLSGGRALDPLEDLCACGTPSVGYRQKPLTSLPQSATVASTTDARAIPRTLRAHNYGSMAR
jgi:hypothetical protein